MRYMRFPKTPPSDRTLALIDKIPKATAYKPRTRPVDLNSYLPWRKTIQLSYTTQQDMYNTAILAGLDPIKHFQHFPVQASSTPVANLAQQRGNSSILNSFAREKKISENMRKMPDKIKAFEQERRKQRESEKPDLPF
ncbi:hypothetical protein SmJEL517_g05655 [Synchytrium microbalum]|uniref:MRPL25 domain-containing protein n=1 Tax=Synchytrium microbalum TaxID=1806994 RepID=A0A507BYJ5_9FUNG|nr:uncharacterized protein SmJEL517_g05655 [Synchytrium microbalum]TPX30874.1 hypothetical protein SmJEL517_g05655 [Synchytrium microbalum]